MDIEVGEYVRTKTDGICKLLKIYDEDLWCGYVDKPFWLRKENIINHSKNIIDLIEAGDYVNGYFVNKITDVETGLDVLCNFDLNTMEWTPLKNIDIWESVVTKEQMSSIEYRVEVN